MEKLYKFNIPVNDIQRSDDPFQYSRNTGPHLSASAGYQQMLQSAEFGKWELNFENGFADGCQLSRSLFGISSGRNSLLKFWKAIDEDSRARFRQSYEEAHISGIIIIDVKISDSRNQQPVWIRIWGFTALKRNDSIAVLQGIMQTVTDRYIKESLASEMVSFVNHEIRSSLATLKLFVQQSQRSLARSRNGDAELLLAKADAKINAIAKLTETFLDTSVLTSGNLNITADNFNLSELLREVAMEFRSVNTNYRFLVIAPDLVGVKADRLKLRQALANLVNNAVKYSPTETTVTLFCQVQIDGIRVTVRDQGVGVSERERSRIFGKFHRASDRSTSNVSGYGIGLFLFKKIIERHEGTVGVLSRSERGTEFFFKLPISRFSMACL